MHTLPAVAAALALLLGGGPAWAEAPAPVADLAPVTSPEPGRDLRPRLTLDLPTHLWWTGGLLALAGASQLLTDRMTGPACRWCEPPQVDAWARQQFLWEDTRSATTIGNALILAVPVGAALTLGLMAGADGASFREGAEDLLIVTEAVAFTLVMMQVAKVTTLRTRPDAWAGSGSTSANSQMSFFAGHASTPFAVAAAGTQLLRLRGRPAWGWFAAATFAGAAASGWFRIASDNHWLTDVVAGAAIGTAVGFAMPGLVLHPATPHAPAVTLTPAPGGLALRF